MENNNNGKILDVGNIFSNNISRCTTFECYFYENEEKWSHTIGLKNLGEIKISYWFQEIQKMKACQCSQGSKIKLSKTDPPWQ